MLVLRKVDVHYGPIQALHDVSLEIAEGEIVTLIGANGAGKSTTLRLVSGLVRSTSGEVLFENASLAKVAPHDIVARGIGQVPEGRRVFAGLTVLENLEMGAYLVRGRQRVREALEEVFELFPRLRERRTQRAGTLSGGEQQMLAIGRTLMSRPKLLLLDEPSLGLAPTLVQTIFGVIADIQRRGVTILLVEQNAHMALRVADRGYVLETGRIVLADTAANLEASPEVRAAYLGE
ncbi:MAG: ABC transporter ATP-binding protein [Armatimonadetes bacterium]|nr:ABC transporter ATP-binding protein [Armatimonadota bacterium]